MNRNTVVFVCALALAACSSKSEVTGPTLLTVIGQSPVVAVVGSAEAAAGDVLDVTFTNAGDEAYWFNPCVREVLRATADGWETMPGELRICNDMAYGIAPSGERVEQVDVPTFATPGTYRFVVPMHRTGSIEVAHRAVSTTFEVR
jgi:hypothetical protein